MFPFTRGIENRGANESSYWIDTTSFTIPGNLTQTGEQLLSGTRF